MNQPFRAVALHYDEIEAPQVTAKGETTVAHEIVALAEEAGVPLYENPELVEILSQMELGERIPENLYLLIAEIIAFAYYLRGKTPQNFEDLSTAPMLKTKAKK